jgi:hypothetical protein
VNETAPWFWVSLLLLGAYHGVNPGMGWLFAVGLGMQERSRRAVFRALGPVTLGHGAAIGTVVLGAGLVQHYLPGTLFKGLVAALLFALGLLRLLRRGHPRRGGMRVGPGALAFWSFLMASAHGAGFMLLPVLIGAAPELAAHAHRHAPPAAGPLASPALPVLAVLVHTAGYLAAAGTLAWLVYEKLGLALLRKAWLNLDLLWGFALLAAGALLLLV